MKRLWFVGLSTLLWVTAAVRVPAAVLQTTLENGLTVLIEENHVNPVVSVQVFVRTGSIYEQEYLGSGISHFFEHIIHGGTTTTRSEAESRALLEAIGNNSNAYTTADHTAYYINTTTEHWTTALELLADWMLHSTIDQREFVREKGVVQREIEQGLDDPRRVLFQTILETRFKVHPARYPVIGYKELVQKITRDDLVTYYQRMYAPNNMILVVVGDVQTAEALEHIKRAFGSGKRRRLPAISLPQEPPQVGKRTAVKEMAITQAHMSLSFRTVPLTHPDLYPLDVLSYILSNGDSSRLVRRIKDERQLVYDISSSSFTPAYAPGSLAVWATLEPDNIQAAQEAILQELYRLKDELVRPAELAKAKKQKIADHVFGQQTVQARARTLGLDMLSTYDPHFSDRYVQNIQRVTAEEIRRVARRYFREDSLVVAVVRPKRQAASTTTTTRVVQAEPVVKKILENGMTLLLKRNPALPVVTMQAYFKGGVRVETPGTNGLSQLMARLLVKGTTSRSASDIAMTFDAMGGNIAAGSGNNSFFVTASCLKEDFPTALAVYADVIMHPSFPKEELEKMRRLMLAALKRQDDDWRSEVGKLFRSTFFTTSPYRMQPEGSEASLRRLQRQDVVAFYQRYAVPNNMVLAIFGDIDVAKTAAAVERAFTGFQPRSLLFPQVPVEPMPTQTRRRVKHTQKQVAAIYIGFPGTTLTNLEDRYPLHILDAIISGIGFPGGWLHTELRGEQLVYVVHAFNWLGLEPGYFGIIAATQPQKVDEVVEKILQNIEKARAGDISDEELARAKRLAVIAERLNRQTNDQLASDAALNELYGLGYDFSRHEQERLQKVTKADVQRVARTYLHHPTIVITTPNREQM
jgi:zinc protease